MSVTVYFGNVSKKRNSTLQGTFTLSYDCQLKSPTSLDRPTFLVSAATMDYNAAKYGNRYYFIDDVVSVRNGQWEVSCILDVLATYKSEILASTQFVTYSSYLSSEWLPDMRLPVEKLATVHSANKDFSGLFSLTGFYVLTVNGQNGCDAYALDATDMAALISEVNNWQSQGIGGILDGSTIGTTYDFSSTEKAIESMGKMLTQTGFIGNAYSIAPQMIRSCIWVPFVKTSFVTGGLQRLYLGNWDTGRAVSKCKTTPETDFVTITIPWQYYDWRRQVCESISIYLPFAGTINLSSDELGSSEKLTVIYSATATDGVVCYEVMSDGGHVIGTFGGSCAVNYAIGINQQASAGQIFQSVLTGADRALSIGVQANIAPTSQVAAIAETALAGVQAIYDVQNVKYSTSPTCIGSFGGGAGVGLSLFAQVKVVTYNTSQEPSAMAVTMGYPTMETMSLSGLSGFCQCANAHVAVSAQAREIDAIDTYLNGGFYIE